MALVPIPNRALALPHPSPEKWQGIIGDGNDFVLRPIDHTMPMPAPLLPTPTPNYPPAWSAPSSVWGPAPSSPPQVRPEVIVIQPEKVISDALILELKVASRPNETLDEVIRRLLDLAQYVREELEGHQTGGVPL